MKQTSTILYLMAILVSLVLGLVTATPSRAEERIVVSSEEWQQVTYANGTGVYFEILRKIYEPLGYELEFRSMSYKKSLLMTINGRSDIWVGSYQQEVSNAAYPKHHFDIDPVEALCLIGRVDHKTNVDDLRLGWVSGYDYHKYLPAETNYREFSDREGIFKMLMTDNIDCYLDANAEIDVELARNPDLKAITERHKLLSLPLYFGFTESAKGKKLAEIFDQRFPALLKKGVIEKIFNRWDYEFLAEDIMPQSASLKK